MRKIKALGITLAAVLAMSAIMVSAAQAAEFTAGPYPATVSGIQIEGKNIFTVGPLSIECETVSVSSETITENRSTLTLIPTYEGCAAHVIGSTFPVTVTMNGCHYLFHATKEGSTYFAHTDIVCPAGTGPIETHVYAPGSSHTAENSVCTFTIAATTGLTGITLTNNATDVKADIDVTDITSVTRHIGPKGSSFTCGLNEHPKGTYTGWITLASSSGSFSVSG